MYKYYLLFIITSLINVCSFTMDRPEQQGENGWCTHGQYTSDQTTAQRMQGKHKNVPSLLTLSQNVIAAGYGETNFDRYKNGANLIMALDRKRNNGTLHIDKCVIRDCAHAYTKHCWTADTDDGISLIRTEQGNKVNKLSFTKSFQDYAPRPLLVKNNHSKNTYIIAVPAELWIIDMQSQRVQQKLTGHTDSVKCCATTDYDEIIISGALDGTIKIWNLNTDLPIQTRQNGATPINLAANKDIFCSLDWKNPTLTIWDLLTCKKIIAGQIGRLNNIHPISLLLKDNMIFVGMEKRNAKIIAVDLRSGQAVNTWQAHNSRITSLIPCNQNEHALYSGSLDGSIKQWDMRKYSHPIKCIDMNAEIQNGLALEGIHETKDGKKIFATDSNNIFVCDITPNRFQLQTRLHLDYKELITNNSIAMNDEETELYIPTHYKGIMTVTPNYVVEGFRAIIKKKNSDDFKKLG